jgi:hypothetical protein
MSSLHHLKQQLTEDGGEVAEGVETGVLQCVHNSQSQISTNGQSVGTTNRLHHFITKVLSLTSPHPKDCFFLKIITAML